MFAMSDMSVLQATWGAVAERKEGSVGFASLGEGNEFVCLSSTPSISSGRAFGLEGLKNRRVGLQVHAN
jgi:hypothetical protein